MTDLSLLNTYFDHIYVLTLHRAHERHELLKKNLPGLQYEFFWGKDNQLFTIEELSSRKIYDESLAKKHHRYNKAMNGGQIGCAWSHRTIYEDIVLRNYQKVLVLEDDVYPSNNISCAGDILNELPADWELLYLDYLKNENPFRLRQYWYKLQKLLRRLKWSYQTIDNLYPRPVSKHIATAGFHDFTSAYAITQSGAKKLLQLQTPISYVADNLLAVAVTTKTLNGYICRPKLFHQLSQDATVMKSYVAE